MRKIWTIALALIAVGTVSPLRGQTVESNYRFIETRHSVGVFAGYLDIDAGRLDLAPRSAPQFGARYDIRLTGPLSGEFALGLAPADRTIYEAPEEEGAPIVVAETNTLVMTAEAGLRFHLTGQRAWRGLAPFVVATAGVVTDLTSSSEFESEIPADEFFSFGPGFALGIGVGSDFFVSERVSLRLELRDYLWRLSYPAGISGTGARDDEWVHNFAPTLGISYHF